MKTKTHTIRRGLTFPTGNKPSTVNGVTDSKSPKVAREWQSSALTDIFDKPLTSIYAPPATGKGVLICMNAHLTLEKYQNCRAVIVAPQRNITKDLKKQDFIHPHNGSTVNWQPGLYLNDKDTQRESITKAFVQWARKDQPTVNDRVCVMTHAALCNIFSNGEKKLFENMILFVDEYHHILFSDDNISNRLGEVIRHFIEKLTEKNLKLCLLTATPFRGDRFAPIPNNEIKNFIEFSHPMDEAMQDFAPLESFGLDFVLYKKSWRQTITELIGDKLAPSLFYIPNVGSPYSTGTKHDDVMEIYRAISGSKKPKVKTVGDYTLVYRPKEKRWLHCIDLVDDTVCREPKLEAISKDHEADKPTIDVIIALDMMIEGANWKWAVNEYIIGNHSSLREIIQMYGRLFRSAKNKTHVNCYYLLANSSAFDNEVYADNYNDYLKSVFATLIMVNVLKPKLIAEPQLNPNDTKTRVNHLTNTFNETDIQKYLDKAKDALLVSSTKNGIDVDLGHNKTNITKDELKVLKSSLDDVLDEMGVTENREQIKNETVRLFKVVSIVPLLNLEGVDVGGINYDFIESSNVHPLACMVYFGSGARNVNTLQELRTAIDASYGSFETFVAELKAYKDKHGVLDI